MHSYHKDFEKYSEDWSQEELLLIDELVKDSLQEDLQVQIPTNFADKVTERIEKRKSIREALLKHLMMNFGLFVILAFAAAILYFKSDQADVIVDFALRFKYPIVFGILIVTAIQLADTFLLSRTKDQLEE